MSAHPRMSIGARAAPPASTFSFPLLSIGDILAIFPDMGLLGLKDKDLSEPKPETAQKIYEQFVYMCMDKSKEELSQPSFSALDAIKWPELHDDSLPRMNLYRSIARLLAACGVSDFSLRDLNKPEGKRLIRHISAVVNFCKLRSEQMEVMQAHTSQLEEAQLQLQDATAERARVEGLVAEHKAKYAAVASSIKEAEATVDSLKETIGERNKSQAILRHETSEDKAEIHRLKDELAAKSVVLAELQAACEKEQSQIVQSPERMKQELKQLASQVREEEEAIADIDSQRREQRNRLDRIAKLSGVIDKLTSVLQETSKELEAKKAASKAVKALQERMDGQKDRYTEMEAQKKAIEKAVQRAGEKLSDFRPAAEMKTLAARKAVTAAQTELDRLMKENSQLDEARGVALSRRDAIIAKRDEERRAHRATMEEMTSSYARLMERVSTYHTRLRASMAQVATPL